MATDPVATLIELLTPDLIEQVARRRHDVECAVHDGDRMTSHASWGVCGERHRRCVGGVLADAVTVLGMSDTEANERKWDAINHLEVSG